MNKYKMVLEHGCGDNSCYFVKPKGMATNGGCRCLQNLGGGRSHSSFLILSVELLSLLTEDNKKLVEALKFYGNERYWEGREIDGADWDDYYEDGNGIGGKLARQVLKEIGEE